MDIEAFGQRLKELRNNKSQTDIVKLIFENTGVAITAQTLGRYENGKRKPDIEIIEALANTFAVSADYLLGLSDYTIQDGDMQAFCKETRLTENAAMLLNALFSENISSIIEAPHFEDVINKIDDLNRYSTYLIEDIERYGLENNRKFSDTVDLYRYRAIKSFERLLDNFDIRIKRKEEFEEIEKQRLALVSTDRAKLKELYQKYHEEKNENERKKILLEISNIERTEY